MRSNVSVPFYSCDFGKHAKQRVKKHSGKKKPHAHADTSVRTDSYKGFDVEIETHYKFTVNGKTLPVHAHVLDSGHIHCPDMPNYGWASAVDFVREMINTFPDDFATFQKPSKKKKKKKTRNKSKKKKSAREKPNSKISKKKRASRKKRGA